MGSGDEQAGEALLPLVYDELRRLAVSRMAQERAGHTLQATALVHEAWLRLGGEQQPDWRDRGQFMAAAAEAMRRILVDRARKRLTAKRGGGAEHLDVNELDLPALQMGDDALLRVSEALEQLAKVDPRKAELVKLRYFVGLNFAETAASLGIAVPTAKQWWTFAKAWLSVELGKER